MSKTIEELVYSFAIRQFHKAPINTERDLMCVCSDFANELLARPLSSRMTAEEKERINKAYAYAITHIEFDENRAEVRLLHRIFGADFFKEEE